MSSTEKQPLLESTTRRRFEGSERIVLGTVLAVIAGLTFTSANVIQKMMTDLHFWNLLLVRSVTQILVLSSVLLYKRTSPFGPPELRIRIYSQGFLGGFLLLAIFIAVRRVPLGDASAIFFSAPFFTMILSTFMLRERFGFYRGFVSGLLLIGVILLCRPPALFGSSSSNFGGIVGTVSAWSVPILSALVTILNRQCSQVDYWVMTYWFGIGAFCLSLIGIALNIQGSLVLLDMTQLEWIYTFIIVFLGIAGNLVMTVALKHITPSKAMVFRSFEVVLNYVLQMTLFASTTPFHISDPIGAAFIVLAVIVMGFEPLFLQRFSSLCNYL